MENEIIGYNNTLSGHYVGPWSITKRIMDGTRLVGYSLRNQESGVVARVERDVFDAFLEKHNLEIPNKATIGKVKYEVIFTTSLAWVNSSDLEKEFTIYLCKLLLKRLNWYIKTFNNMKIDVSSKAYIWDNLVREESLEMPKVIPAIGENLDRLNDEIINQISGQINKLSASIITDCCFLVDIDVLDNYRKGYKKACLKINELLKSDITYENIGLIDTELRKIKAELGIKYSDKAYKRGEKIKRK